MSVLIGHPTGTPFAHQAALAHLEAGWLDAFCVPWMPSAQVLSLLQGIHPLRDSARRLGRRRFEPLAGVHKIEGRSGEVRRLILRMAGFESDALVKEANDWVMEKMASHAHRPGVTALHAYEDCALDAFIAAHRTGRSCIYDLPIGYHRAWARIRGDLESRYADWALPSVSTADRARFRKTSEIQLADVVLVPSRFVARTVSEFHPSIRVEVAPYGVDLDAWPASPRDHSNDMLTFLFAGQCSIRKGVPLLLEAWRLAGLKGARLNLVGSWRLAENKKRELPEGVTWIRPVATDRLRSLYAEADVFVFPTNFEGRALVVLEALASGLPVLTTEASGADDAVGAAGRLVEAENIDSLVEALRWFAMNRDRLPTLSAAARQHAEACSWASYRRIIADAVRPLV